MLAITIQAILLILSLPFVPKLVILGSMQSAINGTAALNGIQRQKRTMGKCYSSSQTLLSSSKPFSKLGS